MKNDIKDSVKFREMLELMAGAMKHPFPAISLEENKKLLAESKSFNEYRRKVKAIHLATRK